MVKISSIIGGLGGLVYTVFGVLGAYRQTPMPVGLGQKVLEFLVLCAFTVPLAAMVGMGLGVILAGLFQRK